MEIKAFLVSLIWCRQPKTANKHLQNRNIFRKFEQTKKIFLMIISNVENIDCIEGMKRFPDKFFDLAIVDPPYGIDADVKNNTDKKQTKKSASKSKKYGEQLWDSSIPDDEYFEQLKRVSKRQIIWGANYFGLIGGMIYWHKNVTMPTYSTGELAWVSWMNKLDFVNIAWHGMIQHNMQNKETRIHPTQKPVALYNWLLENYAKQGDKILDTHLGSQSSRIAAYKKGFDFWGFEIDKDYFEQGNERFEKSIAMPLFDAPKELSCSQLTFA